MAGYYRLRELGYALPQGFQVLPEDDVAALDAATRLLDDAESRAAAIEDEAREGYRRECARGFDEGIAQARVDTVERLLKESSRLDMRLRDVEHELALVVVSCVRRLIHDFDDITKAEAVVRNALGQMRREKRAELRVSPEQFGHFRAVVDDIIKAFPEVQLVDVVEDAGLVAPQIVLETSIGRVEGDLGQNLIELERTIREAVMIAAAEAAAPAGLEPKRP